MAIVNGVGTGAFTFTGTAFGHSMVIVVTTFDFGGPALSQQILVTGIHSISGGASATVTLEREVGGDIQVIRGTPVETTDDVLLRVDHEAPLGGTATYRVIVDYDNDTTSTTTTVSLATATLAVLADPISGDGVALTILEWEEREYPARASVLWPAGRSRPVVISDTAGSWRAVVAFRTTSRDQRDALRERMLSGDRMLLRVPQGVSLDVEDDYVSLVGTLREARANSRGTNANRRVEADLAQVTRPDTSIEAIGSTLQDIADAYPTGTLQDLYNDFDPGTLLDIALFEFGAV